MSYLKNKASSPGDQAGIDCIDHQDADERVTSAAGDEPGAAVDGSPNRPTLLGHRELGSSGGQGGS